jgi:PKHD-type hydroxylase
MPYIIPQPVREQTAPYVFFENIFTAEECQTLIDLHKELTPNVAQTGGGANGEGMVSDVRKTEVFWIAWEEKFTWFFDRLANCIGNANNKWWGFHLAGMNEHLQLTHYKSEENGHYDWHEDTGHFGTFQLRKISLVILLNDEFEGGEFEFLHMGQPPELKKGSVILFPSYMTHRVKPVTKGDRWSLVSWVSGPPWI